MTPEEARMLRRLLSKRTAPSKVTDPLTGVITTREVTMPAFVRKR